MDANPRSMTETPRLEAVISHVLIHKAEPGAGRWCPTVGRGQHRFPRRIRPQISLLLLRSLALTVVVFWAITPLAAVMSMQTLPNSGDTAGGPTRLGTLIGRWQADKQNDNGSAVVSTVDFTQSVEVGPTPIWMRETTGEWAPTVLMRKVVRIDGPISGTIQVYTKQAFDIFINGRQVGSGDDMEEGGYVDVTRSLRRGDNVIAVQARRVDHETPGIGVRFRYHTALTRQTVETDSTWVVAQRALPMWKSPIYNDRTWQEAAVVPRDSNPPTGLAVPSTLAAVGITEANTTTSVDAMTDDETGNEVIESDLASNQAADEATELATDRRETTRPGNRHPARDMELVGQDTNESSGAQGTTRQADQELAARVSPPQRAEITGGQERPAAPTIPVMSRQDFEKQGRQAAVTESREARVAPVLFTESVKEGAAIEEGAGHESPENRGEATNGDSQPKPSAAESPAQDEIELRVPEQFTVEAVASSKIGSLIKIEFDEFGRILASRETGGLVRIDLSLPLEHPQRVVEVCDQVSAIQGLLPLNGAVYVTGVGPEGLGVYLLQDLDSDSLFENVSKICGIQGQVGEHGPHAIGLGTDRMLYVLLGNHTQLEGPISGTSPVRSFYEGDLLPRYEDPSGHAANIKAPGGTLVRMSLDGKQQEIVAGGLRNAYSFAFNQQGDVILHDSDMESDEGTSWYRPTQIYHAIAGADFGWRSGWSKWPDYYVDGTPAMAKTGRGSPSGAVVYDHVMFPQHYQNAFFTGDWAAGRILVCRMTPRGGSYRATMETFMEGRPLNVTDLAIGPRDGALYVALGGRQSSGGIYRVRWTGPVPSELTDYGNPWEEIIRAPMFYSAMTRQRIAVLKQQVTGWDETLRSVALNKNNIPSYRIRALDIMQWFGPIPTSEWLAELSLAEAQQVRAKVAAILGTRHDEVAHQTLLRLLEDSETLVQRVAAESLLRHSQEVPVESLLPLFGSQDPSVVSVARRLLERQPIDEWESWLEKPAHDAVFQQASLAAMIAYPNLKRAYDCLVGVDERLEAAVNEPESLLPLLRITQLALSRGKVDPQQIPAFATRISEIFPAEDSRVNRELASLLAYLQANQKQDRYVEYLQDASVDVEDRLHFAMHLQRMGEQLEVPTQMAILTFLEGVKSRTGGGSYQHYVMQACRDLAKTLPAETTLTVLEQGADLPNAALMMLSNLPKPLTQDYWDRIEALDQALAERQDPSSKELKIGLLAVMGETLGDTECQLRAEVAERVITIWKRDTNLRQFAAVAMAQTGKITTGTIATDAEAQTQLDHELADLTNSGAVHELPAGQDSQGLKADVFWTFLIQSLPSLSDFAAEQVFECFLNLEKNSQNPDHLRQVLLIGLRYPSVAPLAIQVLEKWTLLPEDQRPGNSLAAWQSWFARRYPAALPAHLPSAAESSRWTVDELQQEWRSLVGDRERGKRIYEQASCANCHVYQGTGQGGVGPDLNGLVQRFSQREIIESMLHPSMVISDRYRSELIQLEDGRVLTGIVTPLAGGRVAIVDSQATRHEISKIDILEIQKSPLSIMPSGLLDPLDAQQVVDLLTYLFEEKRTRTAANQ